MIFDIKGNYFQGNFHLPSTTGLDSTNTILRKKSPANLNQTLWEYPIDYRHITNIIDSLGDAFNLWKKIDLEGRIQYLKRYQKIISQKVDKITQAISLETGRPLYETKDEVLQIIEDINIVTSDVCLNYKFKDVLQDKNQNNAYYNYRPIGPTLIITPFTFPCLHSNRNMIMSLLLGNNVVLKPSQECCFSSQLLIESLHEAEFPSGVINLIHDSGDGEAIRRLIQEKSIKAVFFTGTNENGLKILKYSYQNLNQLVSLSLGGINTCIVHNDIDIDYALKDLLYGAFASSGQRCTSTSIVAINKKISEEFISKFHKLAKKIIIDHPIDYNHGPFMGPLISQKAVDNYLLYIGMAKREGITEIMRGKKITPKFPGHYVTPSIHLSDKFNKKSHFLMSEIMGPHCTFIPYSDIDEAISIANSTEYGFVSSIYSNNKNIQDQCLEEIDCGIVNINLPTTDISFKIPFGGIKNSGNYRPNGMALIHSCTYPKSGLIQVENIKNIEGFNNIIGLKN